MKNVKCAISAIALSAILVFSCNKEDEEKLSISNILVESHEGSTEIPLGGSVGIEFDAIAGEAARLDYFHLEIHDHPESGKVEDEYKIIDDSFKDEDLFKGLRNAHVHKHISIPDTANLGSYHVVITVVDEDGNSINTENLETHITVIE